MKQKKCPHCGEYVQKNDLTCPKCFREVPRGPPAEYEPKKGKKAGNKRRDIMIVLSTFPAFFGLLGLGLIYKDPKNRSGYLFLAVGLLIFLPSLWLLFTMLRSGFFSALLMFIALAILTMIYISAAAAALLETLFGSVFKVLRF